MVAQTKGAKSAKVANIAPAPVARDDGLMKSGQSRVSLLGYTKSLFTSSAGLNCQHRQLFGFLQRQPA